MIGFVRGGAALTLPLSVADRRRARDRRRRPASRAAGPLAWALSSVRWVISAGSRQPHRRAPVSGAAADVDLGVAVAVQARPERLLQPHEVPERPDLAAVRVPGESAARRRTAPHRAASAAGGPAARARASGRARRARAPAPPPAAGRRSDAADRSSMPARSKPSSPSPIETRSLRKHANTEPRELFHPRLRAREIFVIAGHEEDAVARAQVGERRDGVAQLAHAAVDQVAGDGDDVGRERVGPAARRLR